jgi:hypothetical protein
VEKGNERSGCPVLNFPSLFRSYSKRSEPGGSAEVVTCLLLIAETQDQSQDSPLGTYGRKSETRAVFCQRTSLLSVQSSFRHLSEPLRYAIGWSFTCDPPLGWTQEYRSQLLIWHPPQCGFVSRAPQFGYPRIECQRAGVTHFVE